MKTFKAELKSLAKSITENKRQLKAVQKVNDWKTICQLSPVISHAQYEFRHRHIAYCLLRGRTMDQIENKKRCEIKCHCCNKPNKKYVDQLIANFKNEKDKSNEVVCHNEVGSQKKPASSSMLPCDRDVGNSQSAALVAEESNNSSIEGSGLGSIGNFASKIETTFRKMWRDILA